MTVTWTSGYGIEDAQAVVEWGSEEGKESWVTPAATLTFTRHDMCGKSTSQIVAILTSQSLCTYLDLQTLTIKGLEFMG